MTRSNTPQNFLNVKLAPTAKHMRFPSQFCSCFQAACFDFRPSEVLACSRIIAMCLISTKRRSVYPNGKVHTLMAASSFFSWLSAAATCERNLESQHPLQEGKKCFVSLKKMPIHCDGGSSKLSDIKVNQAYLDF